MERIFPPLSKGYMIRPNSNSSAQIVDLVSELGIFGVVIGYVLLWIARNAKYLLIMSNYRDKHKIMINQQVGHMLRTKLSSANEGGVAAGLGALDSPYLIDWIYRDYKVYT